MFDFILINNIITLFPPKHFRTILDPELWLRAIYALSLNPILPQDLKSNYFLYFLSTFIPQIPFKPSIHPNSTPNPLIPHSQLNYSLNKVSIISLIHSFPRQFRLSGERKMRKERRHFYNSPSSHTHKLDLFVDCVEKFDNRSVFCVKSLVCVDCVCVVSLGKSNRLAFSGERFFYLSFSVACRLSLRLKGFEQIRIFRLVGK